MIVRFLFRTDALTGNRMLRTGLIVGALLTVGLAIWLASVLTTSKVGRRVDGLNLDHSAMEAAGRRQMPVNSEIAVLVARAPEQIPGFGSADASPQAAEQHAEGNVAVSGPPRLFQAGSPRPPHEEANPDAGEKDTPPKYPEAGRESGMSAFATGRGAFGSAPLAQFTGYPANSTGSAVVFKRQEDAAIQKRDIAPALNKPGLAAGTVISCQLLTGIVSGAALPVMLRIRENVVYRGAVIIPAGSTLIGTSEANYESRRLFVRINRLIIGDAEINICASVSDASGRAGLCDRYIDTARQQLLPAFFAGVLAEFGRVFSDRDAISGVIGPGLGNAANQVASAFFSGTSSGLDAVAQTLAARAKEAKAVMIAYSNRVVQAVLEDKIPLESLLAAIRGK